MPSTNAGRIVSWIIAIVIFYVLTSATVSSTVVEQQKQIEQQYTVQEPYVIEKMVTSTEYKTEKVPYGTPRCEQMTYNYSSVLSYHEELSSDGKTGICTYTITNQEDLAGNFTFHVQFFRNGAVSDGPDQDKQISPMSSVDFTWNRTVSIADTLSCLLQVTELPKRMKCFYLEPITYQIKQIPYTVTALKNVTEYKDVNKSRIITQKVNETENTYTNRFFGYNQFFYFGY